MFSPLWFYLFAAIKSDSLLAAEFCSSSRPTAELNKLFLLFLLQKFKHVLHFDAAPVARGVDSSTGSWFQGLKTETFDLKRVVIQPLNDGRYQPRCCLLQTTLIEP